MDYAVLNQFIVFEGLDGSGTTTQMRLLAEAFDKAQIDCHATFEPTDSSIGSLVRKVLRKELVTTPWALAMLFAADREDHLHRPFTGITSRLAAGSVVICDRYVYSSLAYQALECGYEEVLAINQFPAPRFIFYLDTPIEVCLERIASRNESRELFERQEFLTQVRDNYEMIFAQLPKEVFCVRIDGSQSIEIIHQEVLTFLRQHSLL